MAWSIPIPHSPCQHGHAETLTPSQSAHRVALPSLARSQTRCLRSSPRAIQVETAALPRLGYRQRLKTGDFRQNSASSGE
jgi:hypothetical protein